MKIKDGYQWKIGRFYCWLITGGPERGIRFGRWHEDLDDTAAYHAISKRVPKGKQKHPLDMTYSERREAVRKLTRKMKWSPGFVKSITTPLALKALENGGNARDTITGEWFSLDTPGFENVKKLTRADFVEDRKNWNHRVSVIPELPKEEL